MLSIKNISGEKKQLHIKDFDIDEIYYLQCVDVSGWAINADFIAALEAEQVEVYFNETILSKNTVLALMTQRFPCSIAVDKDNIDQSLSGNDWTEITAVKAIWDLGINYDLINNDFVIPFDGIYFFDLKVKLTEITNCTDIEIALYKREEIEDDYWFIVDKKKIDGDTEIILSGATMYDFNEDEKYCIKIKLYGTNASAKVIGCDDYTAWGFNFENSLYQGG